MAFLPGLLLTRTGRGADTPGPSEHEVKAAMLFNLPKYVEWPAASFPKTNSPILLGILGPDNFGDDFKRMIEEKIVNGRKLLLKPMAWGEDVKNVHLLFVSASETRRLPEILAKLKDANVLTVGETDSFIQLGGMINLARKNNRIRLEVNPEAAERAHLKISSKLLGVSDIIKAGAGTNHN